MESQDVTPEVWRPVPGHESWYSVSDRGRVRSDRRRTYHPVGFIRKSTKHHLGYYVITLHTPESTRQWFVHGLVAAAFLGPKPRGLEINHRDGNKANNRLDNLEYVTKSQNAKHAISLGLWKMRGETHPKAKLSSADVLRIRAYRGIRIAREIAAMYGVTPGTVYLIWQRRTWVHI